jgi:hypothetical protein
MKAGLFYFLSAGLLFVCSCNQKQSPQQTSPGNSVQQNGGNIANSHTTAKDSSLSSSWYVKGCAEIAARGETKFPSKVESKDNPGMHGTDGNSIRAEGDSIIYERFVSHGCCRKVRVNSEKQGNVITITEFWWGKICKCMCSSDVTAVIRQLPKGEYRVYAIETGTDPIDDKPTSGKDTVMSQLVTIK